MNGNPDLVSVSTSHVELVVEIFQPESQSQWLLIRHGSINVVPASIGLKMTDQT